jgi:UDP-N-acetylglucosamine--N-acetylmuramyl-(pentapeptide) pyrophosphoryl-undecaprenol N-acetylglucosamine transferase
MNQVNPILIAAGGTGGHIFPALAVADELEERQVPVVWVGTRQGLEARVVPAAGIDIRWISVAGMRGKGIVGSVVAPFKLLYACLQSIGIVVSVRPAAVLGMGGFVSGPVGIASLLLRKPLILHEQNAVAGMTNRWLSRFATRVFSAMPNVFPEPVHAQAVGNPVRREIANLAAIDKQAATESAEQEAHIDKLHILVVGGSRGARVLNETVPLAIKNISFALDVRHQTGPSDFEQVRRAYATIATTDSNLSAEAFIDDMAGAYHWADIIVCRAGAMTVTELSAAGLPAILVPFPHAVDDHQTQNARYLSEAGAALLMQQSTFNANSLSTSLATLHDDRQALDRMALAARSLFRAGAADCVADALLEVAC